MTTTYLYSEDYEPIAPIDLDDADPEVGSTISVRISCGGSHLDVPCTVRRSDGPGGTILKHLVMSEVSYSLTPRDPGPDLEARVRMLENLMFGRTIPGGVAAVYAYDNPGKVVAVISDGKITPAT